MRELYAVCTIFFFFKKKTSKQIHGHGKKIIAVISTKKKKERKKMKQLQTRSVLGKRLDRVKQVNIQLECRNFI